MGKRLSPEEKRARAAAMELEALRDEKNELARDYLAHAQSSRRSGDYAAAVADTELALAVLRELRDEGGTEGGDR